MPQSKRSRITLHRRSADSVLIQWRHPSNDPQSQQIFGKNQPGTILNVGVVELLDDDSVAFIPARSPAALAAIGHPKIQRRISQVLQTVCREIMVEPQES